MSESSNNVSRGARVERPRRASCSFSRVLVGGRRQKDRVRTMNESVEKIHTSRNPLFGYSANSSPLKMSAERTAKTRLGKFWSSVLRFTINLKCTLKHEIRTSTRCRTDARVVAVVYWRFPSSQTSTQLHFNLQCLSATCQAHFSDFPRHQQHHATTSHISIHAQSPHTTAS